MNRNGTVEEIKNAQGWKDDTLIDLALEFIATLGSEEHFEKWLQLRADAENAEGVQNDNKL